MPKNNTTKKAVVATVTYAGFKFPGLQLPDGSYAIAVPQIVDLLEQDEKGFRPSKNTASRDFKRLLGKRFRPSKVATELDNTKINVVDLETFGLLMVQIALRDSNAALAIVEASVTTTIEQAFDIAFDNKRSLEEYQEKQEARVQGKVARRNMTNVVRDYVKAHSDKLSDNYQRFIYSNCSDRTLRLVFGRSAKQLKEDWECDDVRAAMTIEELFIVRGVEDLAMKLIEQENIEPQQAIDEAGKRLMIKKIGRK